MITFNDFVHKHNLRNKATSNIKIQHVFSSLSLDDVGIYLRDGPFKSDIGIGNLHPSKGTHWVCYVNEKYIYILVVRVVFVRRNYLNLL